MSGYTESGGRQHSSRIGFTVDADINSDVFDFCFLICSLSGLLCCIWLPCSRSLRVGISDCRDNNGSATTSCTKRFMVYALKQSLLNYTRGWGRDSSVGIATRYGLDGLGIESRCGRDFPHPSRPALWFTQPPIQWVPGLSRGQSGRGLAFTHPIYRRG